MPKSETLSTAAKPDDLEKAYASALKALSVMGIKMTTKKPDVKKLTPLMAGNKKALYKLGGTAKAMKMTLEVDGSVNTLGIFDATAERDLEKRVAILRSLVASDLGGEKELKEAEKELKGGADPKVLANLNREIEKAETAIAEARKQSAGFSTLGTWTVAKRSAPFMKDVEAYAKKTFAEENLLFLKAVEGNMARDKLMTLFINPGSKYQVDVASKLREDIVAGTKEPADAKGWIEKDVTQNLLAKVIEAKQTILKTVIDTATKRLKELEAQKKKLAAG